MQKTVAVRGAVVLAAGACDGTCRGGSGGGNARTELGLPWRLTDALPSHDHRVR